MTLQIAPHPRHARAAVAVAAMALALAACGSSDVGGATDAAAQAPPAAIAPEKPDAPAEDDELADADAPSGPGTPQRDDKPADKPVEKPADKAGESAADAPANEGKPAPAPAQTGLAALPDISVVRVASGETVELQSLANSGKPTLLWFWAPHCPFCKAEAPKVLEFEKAYGDEIQVLGLGAQDDLDQAEGFLAETRTSGLEMVWDRTGTSWIHYKVTNQPTVIVLNPDGKVERTWFREFDVDGIRKAAGIA